MKEGRKDCEKIANEHLALLASRVPRLAVHVVREEPDLEVKVDGTVLRKPAWDLLTVVDPGAHVIDASAPGRAPFRQTITLAEGEQRTVQIPALTLGDSSTSAAATPAEASTTVAKPGSPAPETKTNPLFIASAATGVAGFVVGLPAGYVWGMMALISPTCHGTSPFFCASDDVRNTWFAVAAVSLSVGVIGTIGLVAFPSKIQVVPTASTNGGGAALTGQF